jgi:TolA-binding protein
MRRSLIVVAALLLVGCAAEAEEQVAATPSGEDPGAYRAPPPPPPPPPPPADGTSSGVAAPTAVAARPISFVELARDARRSRTTPRAIGLLVVEIQQLETLYAATAARAADRPQLLRRLAEDYVELENGARLEAERTPSVAHARKTTIERARAAAIRDYATLIQEYSGDPSTTFPQTPPPAYAVIDEARYYLAWEYEQADDLANARRGYLDLITKSPDSKYVPLAYFAFGELFRQEGDADPTKLTLAKAAYEKVVASPPPSNRAFGWAWFRMGQVAEKQGDHAGALAAYRRAIDFAKEFSQLPGSSGIEDAVPVWVAQAPPDPWWNGAPDGRHGPGSAAP